MKTKCYACGGIGYFTKSATEYAIAELCDCVKKCQQCDGKGNIFKTDETGYSFTAPCDCYFLRNRIDLYNRAKIPPKYHGKILENFECRTPEHTEIIQFLVNFRLNFKVGAKGFLISGATGTGKTHILCAILRYLTLELGTHCIYVDFFHLLSKLKENYDQGRGETDIIQPIVHIPVLAIDELGKGRNSDWELNILDQIITKRYNMNTTTLFTTNYPILKGDLGIDTAYKAYGSPNGSSPFKVLSQNLVERLGDRIYSRICEMCALFNINGPDYRKQQNPG